MNKCYQIWRNLQVALHVTKICTARCAGNLSSLGEELNSAKPSSCSHPCQRVLLMQEPQISSDSLITVFYNWWSNNVPHKLQKKISRISLSLLSHLCCILPFVSWVSFWSIFSLHHPPLFHSPVSLKLFSASRSSAVIPDAGKAISHQTVLFSFKLPRWNNKCQLHCWWCLHHTWFCASCIQDHNVERASASAREWEEIWNACKPQHVLSLFAGIFWVSISCHITCCPLIVDANRAASLQKGWWTSSKLAFFTTFLHSCALVDRRLRNS